MENKIREYWSSRLKNSRAKLLQKCHEHCQRKSVPKYTCPTFYEDGNGSFDDQVIVTYKCVQDGKRVLVEIKDALLQMSNMKTAKVNAKWSIVQVGYFA